MKVLVFDNYDSFTYNLVQLVEEETGQMPDVYRNDQIDLEAVDRYDQIILSPGPGLPAESGILMPLLKRYASSKSILGVCLGHQAIGECFGASLFNLEKVMHGVATPTHVIYPDPIFAGLPTQFNTGRYHSWAISEKGLPDELIVTARDQNGVIMAIRHQTYKVCGVQFHPESILTEHGAQLIHNWLQN